jgi:ketosteroid isomerase-like protein
MRTAENKETIRRIYAALEHGDRSVFGASVHPDYIWRFPGHCSWSKRFSGQEEVRSRLLKPLFALFATEYKAKAINLIAEGDTVVAEVRGDVQTKTGKRYNNEYCFLFRFRGDKIAEIVEYCDTDLEERVLGPYDDAVRQLAAAE